MLSCVHIAKREDFKDFNNLTGWSDSDKVCLELEFNDTIKEVDISLLGQIFQSERISYIPYLKLLVKVTSPDSLQFSKTLNLPLGVSDSTNYYNKIGRLVEYEWSYLTNYKPRKKGVWRFELVQIGNSPEQSRVYRHLYGIGIKYQ